MAATGGDVPDRFHDAIAYSDVLIPAIHHDILLAAVEQEAITHLERRGAISAQHDMLGMPRPRR